MQRAKIDEVFLSLQGEGIYIGSLFIFVRFLGCNLHCRFCDTKSSWDDKKRYARLFFDNKVWKMENPVHVNLLVNNLEYYPKSVNWLSLTGGEPLLQADFLSIFIEKIKKNQAFSVYLETNGTLANEFEKVKEKIDFVSMDIKLFSFCQQDTFHSHREFLKKVDKKKASIKIVINQKTQRQEIEELLKILRGFEDIPVILQLQSNKIPEILEKSYEFLFLLKKELQDVRVLPQLHKIFGIK